MTKVKVLLPFVQGKKSFGHGETLPLDPKLAYSLAKKGVVEFLNKKEFTALDEQIKKDEQEAIEEKEEQERQVAAILEKDFLENKRKTLQTEIDSITHILGDAQSYYKTYIDLVEDLNEDKLNSLKDKKENKSEEEK